MVQNCFITRGSNQNFQRVWLPVSQYSSDGGGSLTLSVGPGGRRGGQRVSGDCGVTLGERGVLGEEGWGRNECKSRTAGWVGTEGQVARTQGQGLGWAWQEAFGPGSFGSAFSPYPVRVTWVKSELQVPSWTSVPLSLERLVCNKKGMATGCQTQLCPLTLSWF